MIVVVVIGILAAIAVPAYQDYVDRSRARVAAGHLVSLAAAVENSFQRKLSYPTNDGDITGWQDPNDSYFSYHYEPDGGAYILEAKGKGIDCKLKLDHKNNREISGTKCGGLTEW